MLNDPRGDLRARGETELCEDVLYVGLGCPVGDHEAGSNLLVAQSLGDEFGYLSLALGEAAKRGVLAACLLYTSDAADE